MMVELHEGFCGLTRRAEDDRTKAQCQLRRIFLQEIFAEFPHAPVETQYHYLQDTGHATLVQKCKG